MFDTFCLENDKKNEKLAINCLNYLESLQL